MSSSLRWRPVRPENSETLSNETKYRISRRLWGTDGTCGSGVATMGPEDREYLLGLADAGIAAVSKDCVTILEAIEKYGLVELWHEH